MTGAAITDVLDEVWRRRAASTAVREAAGALSFGELLAWSERVSAVVERLTSGPGHRVALVIPNSAAFVSAFFGVVRAGGVAAPLNPRAPAPELGAALADLDPAGVVTTPSLLDAVRGALQLVSPPPPLLVVSHPAGVDALTAVPRPARALPAGASPPLLQLATSGSTGSPKRVVRSHAALLGELAALRKALGVAGEDRFLGVAPFHHVNGLVRTMMLAMSVGAELHPLEQFRRREVLEALTERRLTVLGAVPQVFVLLAQTPPRGAIDLSSLRVVFSASAPLLPADNERFRARYGVVVRQLYGSTETGSMTFNDDPDPAAALDSVGRPLDGVTIRIVDEQQRPVEGDGEGEILAASPFAAGGYLDDPEESARGFRAGFYRTGDLGRLDARGQLRLTGRRKLLINRGGFKVNPYEVEAALAAHPDVAEAVVFGVPGAHGDETVACIVVPRAPCTPEALVAHCRERLADYKVPGRIEFRPSLPRSASGKVLRGRVAES